MKNTVRYKIVKGKRKPLGDYEDRWVIICESEVIAQGNNLKEMVAEAKKKCRSKKLLITKVPSDETIIF